MTRLPVAAAIGYSIYRRLFLVVRRRAVDRVDRRAFVRVVRRAFARRAVLRTVFRAALFLRAAI